MAVPSHGVMLRQPAMTSIDLDAQRYSYWPWGNPELWFGIRCPELNACYSDQGQLRPEMHST